MRNCATNHVHIAKYPQMHVHQDLLLGTRFLANQLWTKIKEGVQSCRCVQRVFMCVLPLFIRLLFWKTKIIAGVG